MTSTAAALIAAASLFISPPGWKPHMRAADAYAHHRRGIIAFAVRTPGHFWASHPQEIFPSASVLKAMLLVAYLRRHDVRHRALRNSDRQLLGPMIRRSDNAAATAVMGVVGAGGLDGLAHRVGMRRFTPVTGIWGNSQIDASDQTLFLLHIDRFVPPRHRAYAMRLLAGITPSQRWGIGRVRPRGWHLYFKGGWGSGTGRVDHQVALLVRGRERVSIAILTAADGSHAYGKETLRGLAQRLLRGLAIRASA